MFNVNLRDKEMRFEFRHACIANTERGVQAGQEQTKDLTYCYLYLDKKQTNVPYAEVHVARNVNDRYVKVIANKRALTKLLSITDFTKEERSKIWKAFFDMRHGKTC